MTRTKKSYTIKYRQPGQWFWRTIKNVWRDEVCYGHYEVIKNEDGKILKEIGKDPLFRAFTDENDNIRYISLNAEVIFDAERQKVIQNQMSKEAGQPVQRI